MSNIMYYQTRDNRFFWSVSEEKIIFINNGFYKSISIIPESEWKSISVFNIFSIGKQEFKKALNEVLNKFIECSEEN